MFKNYFECLDLAYKLEEEGFEVKRYNEDFVIKSLGYEIANIKEYNGVEIIDINYLLFDNKINELDIKKIIKDYTKLINFVLNTVDYRP